MIVYSVSVLQEDGVERIEGPWAAEWMAEAWAEENDLDSRRTVISWQMLNATDKRAFKPCKT